MKKLKEKQLQKDLTTERAQAYIVDNIKLLRKHHLKSTVAINFKNKKTVPFLSKLALRLLTLQGAILDTRFENLE